MIKNNLADFKQKLQNPALFHPIDTSTHSTDAYDLDGMDKDSAALDLEVEEMMKAMKKEQQAKIETNQAIQQKIVALTIPSESSQSRLPTPSNLIPATPSRSSLNPSQQQSRLSPVQPEDHLKSHLSMLPPAHKVSHLEALASQDSGSSFGGSALDKPATSSAFKPPITSYLPSDVDVDKLLDKIEKQEEKKMKSALQQSHLASKITFAEGDNQGGDYSEINNLLNLIETRIKLYLHLGTNLLQICGAIYKKQHVKLLFFKGVVYSLIFQSRNLVNKVLQLLSEEESEAFTICDNWEEFLQSHDHSIHTDNFTNLATMVYKALWTQYKKMEPVIKSAQKNPLMVELQKMIHKPDSKLGDISDSLDTFLAAVDSSLKGTLSSVVPIQDVRKEVLLHVRTQLVLARTMYHLGVFTDAETYAVYELDPVVARNLGKWDESRPINDVLNDLNLAESAYSFFTNPPDMEDCDD